MSSRPDIELTIEALVLDGFDGVDSGAVGVAVEQALADALAADQRIAALQGGSFERIHGRPLSLGADATPREIGDGIARSVIGGLGR